MQQFLKIVGIIVSGIILCLGVYYAKERVLYLDSAFYFFQLLNTKFFVGEHYRFGLWIAQIPAWIGVQFNVPIHILVYFYSIGYLIIILLCWFFAAFKNNMPFFACIILIMQLGMQHESFYLCVNETALSISACILFLSLIINNKNKTIKQWFIIAILLYIILFSHPTGLIILIFGLFWLYISKFISIKNAVLFCVIVMGIFIVKKIVLPVSGYESNLYAQLFNWRNIILNIKNEFSYQYFTGHIKHIFYIPIVFNFISIMYFAIKKNWFQLSLYILANIGIFLLLSIIFHAGDGHFFMEKNYMPILVFAALPLTLSLDKIKNNYILKFCLIIITLVAFFTGFYGINKKAEMYSNRYEHVKNMVSKYANKEKLFIPEKQLPADTFYGLWALPYETAIISKLECKINVTIKTYNTTESLEYYKQHPTDFWGADFYPAIIINKLNKNYFPFDNRAYRITK